MKTAKIGKKILGDNYPCFISLEPGATHEGMDSAKALLKAVADSGADAVKFQTFLTGDADRMMGKKDIMVEFGTEKGKMEESVYEAFKRRELSKDEWKELFLYSHELGIGFITAPYFTETVDFLAELKIDAIKISKGDVNNVMLVGYAAKTGLPMIIDGREKFEDVEKDVQICQNNDIVIMHCPSGYPAKDEEVHLSAIKTIKDIYGYPVGFADHSKGTLMNFAAVALGANMLEKTITLDKSKEQVEHYMSLEPQELNQFVKDIRSLEKAMGNSRIIFQSRVGESNRRSFAAKRDIKEGEEITDAVLDFKRPGDAGISCSRYNEIIGKRAKKGIKKDQFIQHEEIY